jgi:hypothetical protein
VDVGAIGGARASGTKSEIRMTKSERNLKSEIRRLEKSNLRTPGRAPRVSLRDEKRRPKNSPSPRPSPPRRGRIAGRPFVNPGRRFFTTSEVLRACLQKARGRRVGARGLQDFGENRGSGRRGALTGRSFKQAPRLSTGRTQFFGFRISDFLRPSDFGLRISCSTPDGTERTRRAVKAA